MNNQLNDAYKQYESNQINTADQQQLIIMLYDGAIKFLNKAKKLICNYKTYDQANINIIKAQDIITELMVSLDLDKGEDIAKNLLSLYSFIKKQLLEANMKKTVEPIQVCINILQELKTSWENIKKGEGIKEDFKKTIQNPKPEENNQRPQLKTMG